MVQIIRQSVARRL